jgi:hypothetical protein
LVLNNRLVAIPLNFDPAINNTFLTKHHTQNTKHQTQITNI